MVPENQTRVTVQIYDVQKTVNVTKQTTCSDVIKTITGDDHKKYTLTALTDGVETVLNRKVKILKVLRSTTSHTTITLRQTDTQTNKCAKISRALRKLKDVRSMIRQIKTPQSDLHVLPAPITDNLNVSDNNNLNVSDNNNLNVSDSKQALYTDKTIQPLTTPRDQATKPRDHATQGKVELMKRFLHDLDSSINTPTTNMDAIFVPAVRLSGDGCSGSPVCPRTRGDGTSHGESFFTSFKFDTTCIYLGEQSVTNHVDPRDQPDDFDTAFVEDVDSVIDSESDVTIDELEMNVIDDVSDSLSTPQIKRLFSRSDLTTWYADDTAMESFMQTILEQDGDDEGVSSMDSDEGSC